MIKITKQGLEIVCDTTAEAADLLTLLERPLGLKEKSLAVSLKLIKPKVSTNGDVHPTRAEARVAIEGKTCEMPGCGKRLRSESKKCVTCGKAACMTCRKGGEECNECRTLS